MPFDIREHLEFDPKGRAICPACALAGKTSKKNLALVPDTDGAYKCHRGCSPKDIRDALGNPKPQQIPQSLARSTPAPKSVTVTPTKVAEAHTRLMESAGPAMRWLTNKGITPEMMKRYQLGVVRSKLGGQMKWAVSIPIPNSDRTAYYQKKRVCPWDEAAQTLPEYQPWKQYGIPQMVYFTYYPGNHSQTWLCEGEWDAIRLGWELQQLQWDIAVACFTCGAGNVPPDEELNKLPGQVTIWYDRNDKPRPDGTRPGDTGAQKVAERLGDRAKIALVPMPAVCEIQGWDVSDALNHGYTPKDFLKAYGEAKKYEPAPPKSSNPLRERLKWNDELIDSAPDYTNFLVPDLLTEDELFVLAAGPRAGKSLMAMCLAKAVAEGGTFLGRPVTQGTVIYVNCEDGDAKIKEREQAQGWSRGLPVAWFDQFKLSEVNHLVELAEELDPRLIVLDTLSRIRDSSVSESSSDMSQLLEPLQELAKRCGCCVLLVHHTGKVSIDNANQIDIFDTIRGSSAIRGVCRGSLIIAAGERDYRLVAENGWGKHDLKVILDANTLTWRLLGNWNPIVNMTQKDQIIDTLKKIGAASVEQLHVETGIPKKSLYEQLSRLQLSEDANEKVIKEGSRRQYTYRLALFNTIQQLNSVLNSENPDRESDRGYSQQNSIFLDSDAKPDHRDQVCSKNHQNSPSVEYRGTEASSPGTEGDSPIQHLVNNYSTVDYKSPKSESLPDHPPGQPQKADQAPSSKKIDPYFPGCDCEVEIDGRFIPAKYIRERDQMKVCPKSGKLAVWHRVEIAPNGKRSKVEVPEVSLLMPLIRPGDHVRADGVTFQVEKTGLKWIIGQDASGKTCHAERSECELLESQGVNHANG